MEGYIDIKIGKTDDLMKPVPGEELKREQPGAPSLQTQAVNTALISTVRQMAKQGLREYGNITGDYATTNMIDTALGIGADLMTLGLGPVGMVAVASRHTSQLITQSVNLNISNRNIDFMLSRMGDVSARGSRYGD